MLGECKCWCKQNIPIRNKLGKLQTFIRGHNGRGEHGNFWKGGRCYNVGGYVWIWKPNHPFTNRSYVFEHRLVWEEYHKAILLPWGVVHHKNEIRDDNKIENLQGMMRSAHPTIHFTKDKSDRFCVLCGSTETAIAKTGYLKWYKYEEGWICNSCYMHFFNAQNKKRLLHLYVQPN